MIKEHSEGKEMDELQLVAKSRRAENPFLAQLEMLTLGLKGIQVTIVAKNFSVKTYHLRFGGVFGFQKTVWLIKSLFSYSLSYLAIVQYLMFLAIGHS